MCTWGEWVQPDPVSTQRLAGSPELSPSQSLPASLSSSVSRDPSPSFWSEKTRQEGSRWHWRSLLQWVLASLGIPTSQRDHGPDFHPLISRLRGSFCGPVVTETDILSMGVSEHRPLAHSPLFQTHRTCSRYSQACVRVFDSASSFLNFLRASQAVHSGPGCSISSWQDWLGSNLTLDMDKILPPGAKTPWP